MMKSCKILNVARLLALALVAVLLIPPVCRWLMQPLPPSWLC